MLQRRAQRRRDDAEVVVNKSVNRGACDIRLIEESIGSGQHYLEAAEGDEVDFGGNVVDGSRRNEFSY